MTGLLRYFCKDSCDAPNYNFGLNVCPFVRVSLKNFSKKNPQGCSIGKQNTIPKTNYNGDLLLTLYKNRINWKNNYQFKLETRIYRINQN